MEKEPFDAPEVEIIRYDETTSIVTSSIDGGLSDTQPGIGYGGGNGS
jgi:hypothetical protein